MEDVTHEDLERIIDAQIANSLTRIYDALPDNKQLLDAFRGEISWLRS